MIAALKLLGLGLAAGSGLGLAGCGKGHGFLPRIHRDPDGKEAKYVLFVPHAYQGEKPYPLILFLHGLGESGTDGRRPTQVGLGPAIRQHEDTFPFLAIFPQSQKRTWQANSADAARALAILAEVQKEYNVDRRRVVLTGISMGGFGTWSLAAKYPERWAAIVPICGGGDPQSAGQIKDIPCWCFHGGLDPIVVPHQSRRMMKALWAAGGHPNYTEYPRVGHDSWDKAYATSDLYEWMLQAHLKEEPHESASGVPNLFVRRNHRMPRSHVNRRDFLKTSAAGAALSLTAASAARVLGANERIGVAFIGTGGRCQEHIGIINKFKKENKGAAPVAVCDVWDGNIEVQPPTGRGLYPSAKRCDLSPDDKQHVTKDYRRVLDLKEVDVVCVATPDHWHAKVSIDAAAAGKDVYCEKPMTKTIEEANIVVDTMCKHNRVMTVGVQSMADPTWRKAYDMIREGGIGHVCQAQTSYYRNFIGGQWRYYRLTKDMTPKTIDWNRFLGYHENGSPFTVVPDLPLAPRMPFDRAVYGQWRCYWPFGGGMFTDLFVHQTTHMIAAMGVRYPARVTGAGGLYLEYDGRDVPDVATVVADYNEGCQLIITATMINQHPIEECIRGRLATLVFKNRGGSAATNDQARKEFGFEILTENMQGGPGLPKRLEQMQGKFVAGGLEGNDTEALWLNFLDCVRSRNRETWSTPELGAAAFTTVNMGVQSYRKGRVLFWDREQRKPIEADSSWAARWEDRSKEHGKPNQIIGWEGGDRGSVVIPPEYQKLAGPWTNGKDPANGLARGDV